SLHFYHHACRCTLKVAIPYIDRLVGHTTHIMISVHFIYLFILQQGQTLLRAVTGFFSWLEKEEDVTITSNLINFQYKCGKSCRMAVMSAFMCFAWNFRSPWNIHGFIHRQGVKVCPESDIRPVCTTPVGSIEPVSMIHNFERCMSLKKSNQMGFCTFFLIGMYCMHM